jgi:hypothetical protein
MRFTIRARTTALFLAGIITALVVANLVVHFGRLELGWGQSYGLRRQFDLGHEANIPTAYSALALLASASLLFLIGRIKLAERDRFRFEWIGLAIGFLFLAIDEATMIHENIYRIPRALGLDIGTLSWMLPYAVILPVLGIIYARFLVHLEPWYRRLFLLAGVLYVGGALGMEASGDLMRVAYGDQTNWPNILVMTAEETLEMSGVAVFLVTLLVYVRDRVESVAVAFR